jgi:hypothetical protein
MCDPITIGTAITAGATLYSGVRQAQAYNTEAQFADRQAVMEGRRGAYEAARTRDANDRKLAAIRSGYMSSGFAIEGSPAAVIEDSATQASLDEQAIKFGARVKTDNLRFQAGQARSNAGTAMFGAVLGAAGNVAGGFARQQDFQSRRTFITNPYLTYGGAY